MRSHIVRVGNSRGVRIPKALLEATGLTDAIELTVRDGALVIEPVESTRAGWDEAFAEMAARGDDELLIDDGASPASSFDEEEWEWQ